VVVHDAYVGLGSNLSHPRRQIARALRALSRLPRTRVIAVSPNYATAPIGASEPQPDYVNAVAHLATALPPRALLAALLAIERRQHRRREHGRRNAPRTLDLDLLLYGRRRARIANLELPHPRMHERAFVLRPLADLAPALAVPGKGAVRQLRRAVSGQRARRTRSHRHA
jgi:2-amino-4-hydroxy-6-hydroxymethyldihydropteridine diphosphokinase